MTQLAPALRTVAVLAATALAPFLAQAQATSVNGVLGGALTFGGDKLATLQYTDGSTQSVSAGGLVDVYAGVQVRPVGGPVSLLATIGYHMSRAGASNGDVTFARVPLELIGMVDIAPRFRLGAGVRYVSNVSLTSSGAAAGAGARDYDDAWGGLVQGEWMATPRLGVVVRYVNESYRYTTTYVGPGDVITMGHARVDGSHGGVGVNWYF